jgi:Na+-transporting methylmalonyl-CoA/oxaloacetate decarboxylase gamma subunit
MLTIPGDIYIIKKEKMNIGVYGILFVFAAFILLLIINPNMSCFGRRVRSPLYPLFRKKKETENKTVIEDYGFSLEEEKVEQAPEEKDK